MTYMTDGIGMDARMTGGILGGLTRKLLAGESLFVTYAIGDLIGGDR
jgi:uncharacterized protein (AIM24 family)